MPIDHDQIRQRIKSVIDADDELSLRSVSLASGSDSWLHKFMTSDASMKLTQAEKLADALGVSADWLLFGEREASLSADAVQQMIDTALEEIQPGMSLAEIRRAAASALHAQLERHLSHGGLVANEGQASVPDTAVQSPAPTKRSARVE